MDPAHSVGDCVLLQLSCACGLAFSQQREANLLRREVWWCAVNRNPAFCGLHGPDQACCGNVLIAAIHRSLRLSVEVTVIICNEVGVRFPLMVSAVHKIGFYGYRLMWFQA